MRPSSSLLGASRLPLTSKQANKDFYKGTGQSYVPGGGHRTGPPGKHVVRGKGKYRLVDEKVRYYVGPGTEALEAASTKGLKPYVSTLIPHSPSARMPSFSPTLPKAGLTVPCASSPTTERTLKTPQQYSKWYWARGEDERQWDIMQARRKWWDGMSSHCSELRGDKTKVVEAAADRKA